MLMLVAVCAQTLHHTVLVKRFPVHFSRKTLSSTFPHVDCRDALVRRHASYCFTKI